MTQLIGITGRARSGKDSLASVFVRHGYRQLAFANSLKATCALIAREERWLWFNDETKEQLCKSLGMTRREVLQKMGSAVRDNIGPNVWVDRLLNTWVKRGKEPAVISDCRYPNEAQAIKSLGGIIIRVVRPGAGLEGEAANHVSEAGIPDDLVDVEIYNDGTLTELGAEALKIVNLLEAQRGN